MNNLCIDVKNLNKHFGEHHVVKDFSLQVAKGRIPVKVLVWVWISLRSGKR